MPGKIKRISEADRAAVVSRYERVAREIEDGWPGATLSVRLPSPRNGVPVVELEITLSALESIVSAAVQP